MDFKMLPSATYSFQPEEPHAISPILLVNCFYAHFSQLKLQIKCSIQGNMDEMARKDIYNIQDAKGQLEHSPAYIRLLLWPLQTLHGLMDRDFNLHGSWGFTYWSTKLDSSFVGSFSTTMASVHVLLSTVPELQVAKSNNEDYKRNKKTRTNPKRFFRLNRRSVSVPLPTQIESAAGIISTRPRENHNPDKWDMQMQIAMKQFRSYTPNICAYICVCMTCLDKGRFLFRFIVHIKRLWGVGFVLELFQRQAPCPTHLSGL